MLLQARFSGHRDVEPKWRRALLAAMAEDTAGVRFPPPLLFALWLLAGLAMDRLVPLDGLAMLPPFAWIGPGTPAGWRLLAGAPLVALGVALDLWAIVSFRRAHTTVLPWGRASFLVPEGPYRFSRNPMYVGMALAYLGLAIVFASWWALAFLPPVLAILARFVVRKEEAHLEARFGDGYRQYRDRVRRWL